MARRTSSIAHSSWQLILAAIVVPVLVSSARVSLTVHSVLY